MGAGQVMRDDSLAAITNKLPALPFQSPLDMPVIAAPGMTLSVPHLVDGIDFHWSVRVLAQQDILDDVTAELHLARGWLGEDRVCLTVATETVRPGREPGMTGVGVGPVVVLQLALHGQGPLHARITFRLAASL